MTEAGKIARNADIVFKDVLRRLGKELRKLPGTSERPQARKNARRRTLSALRLLRAAVDREYPAIVERGEVKRRDPEARMKAMRRAGWIETGASEAGRYAAAGVTVKRVAWKLRKENPQPSVYVNGKGWVAPPPIVYVKSHEHLFVPPWAAAIGPDNPTRLRQAKRSRVVRNAALVEKALSLVGTEKRRPVRHSHIKQTLALHQAAFDQALDSAPSLLNN